MAWLPSALAACAVVTAAFGAGLSPAQAAGTWPDKPVSLIVPYPAGGPSDFIARKLAPVLTGQLGQQVIVENIGGASGSIGVQRMLASGAQGYAMALVTPTEVILAPLSIAGLPYRAEDSRLAGMVVATDLVLVGRPDLPAADLDALIQRARDTSQPGLSYGSIGPGSLYHLAGEQFSQTIGAPMLHVPYRGVAPLITDLMGGTVDVAFLPFAAQVQAQIASGKLKAYGLAANQPHPRAANVPLLSSHAAVGPFAYELWAGLVMPRDVPQDVIDRVNQAVRVALEQPDVRSAFEETGNRIAAPRDVAALAGVYEAETRRYGEIAKAIQLQPN